MVIQNILKEKSIYEIQFCIRNIIVITKVRSRQAGLRFNQLLHGRPLLEALNMRNKNGIKVKKYNPRYN